MEKWHKLLSREGVDITSISGIDVLFIKLINEFSNQHQQQFFTHFEKNMLTHYIAVDQHALGTSLYERYFSTSSQIETYYAEGLSLLTLANERVSYWKHSIQKARKEKRLLQKLLLEAFDEFKKQFMKICDIYSITSWLAIEAWQSDFQDLVTRLIKKNRCEKETEIILYSLCMPWKKTALLEIQDRFKKGVSLQELLKEYQFLRSWSVVWFKPLDETWIKNIVQSVSEHDKQIYSLKQLISLLKPTSEEQKFLEMASYIVFFKDWRDDLRRKQVYEWSFLFDAIADYLTVDRFDLGYLLLDEINSLLKDEHLTTLSIPIRKQTPLIITGLPESGQIFIEQQEKYPFYEKIINKVHATHQSTYIKGLVAYVGKAKGKVIVVNSYHDIKKVQEGDILVANTTHPTYLPAMCKAAAFITNEGGIMSHAAIIAREMKKPCIVGTKTATKYLMTGDMVEVDANNGIVKKIPGVN